MSDSQPPLDFFLTSSATGLQSFELSRMNRAANLRKELRQVMEEWIQAEVNARVARWVLESRRAHALACQVDLLPATGAAEPHSSEHLPLHSPLHSPQHSFEQLPISFLPAHEGPSAPLPALEFSAPSSPADDGDSTVGPVGSADEAARSPSVTVATPDAATTIAAPRPSSEERVCWHIEDVSEKRSCNVTTATPPATPAPLSESASECAAGNASALDRCAQQSVAVLHDLGRAAPPHRRTALSSASTQVEGATLLRRRPTPTPARSFVSREYVHAVA